MSAIATTINVKKTEQNIANLQGQANAMFKEIRTAVEALVDEADMLPDDMFWFLMEELKTQVRRNSGKDGTITHAIAKGATKSTLHNITYGHIGKKETGRETALQFVKTFQEKSSKLYKPLFDVIKGFGDDGYGDILDSFLLFGQERYEKALKGEIVGSSEDQYQGENYFSMSLDDALYEVYAQSCQSDLAPDFED